MAKLTMKKIEIIALLKDSRSIMERLQRRGVVEISDVSDGHLLKMNVNSNVSTLERSLAAVMQAEETLDYYSFKKEPLMKMLEGRKAITTDEFAKKKEKTGDTLKISLKINECAGRINEYKNNIARIKAQIEALKVWENMNLPQNFKGTQTTDFFMGTFQGDIDCDFIENEIKKENENVFVCIEAVSRQKEQTCVTVICHKEHSEKVFLKLRELGFQQNQSTSPLTPYEEIEKCIEEIKQNEKNITQAADIIKSFDKKRDDMNFLKDYLVMKKDKYEAFSKASFTENVAVLSGFIPEKYVDKLVFEFENKYTVAIKISEPEIDEDIPVLLSNGSFSEPVEGITHMYALPNRRDVDPSPVMAFFYYLFFGMMLSDAGYGILMIIATTYVLKKTTVEGNLRKSIRMFQYCGISTLFWGALFGSWFGDLPQIIASNFLKKNIETTALWFEPLDDPIKLLLFSFGLGIAHLFLGLWVNFKILLKEGKPFDAVCEVFPIYFTVLGVAPIGASILSQVPAWMVNTGKYLAIIGVIAIVLTSGRSNKNIFMRFFGGIYGLYNVATGYLGDILSYSRLLALGLATGSIASVINLIATMPENTFFKAIMLIVVGVVGHTANLGINLLGAYVHADRLQFVELFSKFYEGGGREFKPLKLNTKYIKFEKENIYG